MARTLVPDTWGRSTVRTACPLDCPDSCTLDVTVEKGRVVKIDGGTTNPVTRNYICAKVRRFGERVYGEDRLLYPAVRKGAKGQGDFTRVTWDEALDQIAERMRADPRHDRRRSDPALLLRRLERPADAGHERRDAVPRRSARRGWRGRCAPRRPAPPTWRLYGKMPGVTYADYVHARLIVLWGVNPSASGIHLVPFVREAQKAGATLVVIDPRATSLARQADLHLAPRPGTDLPIALALHRFLFEGGFADERFLAAHTRGADRAARARGRVDDRARGGGRRHRRRGAHAASRSCTRDLAGAGALRLGTRAQPQRRQRRGRGPRAAGGRRQVRRPRRRLLDEQLRRARHQGGGVDERHARAGHPPRQHEPSRTRAARVPGPAGRDAVRLQLQPAGDDARSEPRARRD